MINTLIAGGKGPERHDYIAKYLDSLNSKNETIIIFDATYSFGSYNQYTNVSYFSADHALNYISRLKDLNSNNETAYIISDIYGGLFFSKENKELMLSLLSKKDRISVTFYTRHLSYVPEKFLEFFDKKIEFEDELVVIANNL